MDNFVKIEGGEGRREYGLKISEKDNLIVVVEEVEGGKAEEFRVLTNKKSQKVKEYINECDIREKRELSDRLSEDSDIQSLLSFPLMNGQLLMVIHNETHSLFYFYKPKEFQILPTKVELFGSTRQMTIPQASGGAYKNSREPDRALTSLISGEILPMPTPNAEFYVGEDVEKYLKTSGWQPTINRLIEESNKFAPAPYISINGEQLDLNS